MSRLKRILHGVASGYAALAINVVFSLASVPMALHFLIQDDLGKKKFALWSLMTLVTNYLSLIDLGMSSSVARLLIDHKDQPNGGRYGGLIQTGWLVLVMQGLCVLLVGYFLAPACARGLKIPPELAVDFIRLLRWQCGIVAFGFATRIFGHLLQAHQRLDLGNYSQMAQLAANFLVLWLAFRQSQGVFSVLWANLAGTLMGALLTAAPCYRLRLFPARGAWGRVCWRHFRELWSFGKDVFLVALGTQFIMASQTIIIARNSMSMGLDAVALWTVGTRMFYLLCQVIWRIFDYASPAFCEMIARGETVRLRARYRAMVMLTGSFSGWVAISYLLCNGPFVTLWTRGAFVWPPLNDLLLGVWMVILALGHCHNGFVLLTKGIGFMRYVFFFEGAVFFLLASWVSPGRGFPAIITCSVLCSLALNGAYGIWRMSRYFDFPLREVAFGWQRPLFKVLCWLGPGAMVVWWAEDGLGPWPRLIVSGCVSVAAGGFVFFRYGLGPELQREILGRSPQRLNPFLKRLFALT